MFVRDGAGLSDHARTATPCTPPPSFPPSPSPPATAWSRAHTLRSAEGEHANAYIHKMCGVR